MRPVTPCHSEERSDEESALERYRSRSFASLRMTGRKGERMTARMRRAQNDKRGIGFYTFFVFHPPRRNTVRLTTASVENAIAIAANTPRGPIPARRERNQASGISKSQKMKKLMRVGVQVSPAPLKACVMTMPTA